MELFAFDRFFFGALLIGFVASMLVMAQVEARNRKRAKKAHAKDAAAVGLLCLEPKQRYQLWRAELLVWAKDDGTREGLEAWIERWRGIPHEKPRKSIEITLEDGTSIQKPLNVKPPEKQPDFIDTLAGAGDQAILRFFQKNREQIRRMIFKGRTSGVATIDLPKYQKGQWLRICGELSIVEDIVGTEVWYRDFHGAHIEPIVSDRIKPAVPRAGEWWRKLKTCALQTGGVALEPHQIPEDGPCGRCIYEPVNFGRGITSGIMRTTSDGPREFTVPRFGLGQWVRCKTQDERFGGQLMQVRKLPTRDEGFICATDHQSFAVVDVDALEPAFPRKNEWWRIAKPCSHPTAIFTPKQPIQFLEDDAYCKSCTWEPVNFGRGEEAKS